MHVGLREGVLALAALHGKSVPDAVDGALAQERVLGIPVDGLQLKVPAVASGHLGGQVDIEAGQVAVVADEAVGRVGVIEAHNKRGGLGIGRGTVVGAIVGRAVVGRTGTTGQKRRAQAQGSGHGRQFRHLLHRFLPYRIGGGHAPGSLGTASSLHFMTLPY